MQVTFERHERGLQGDNQKKLNDFTVELLRTTTVLNTIKFFGMNGSRYNYNINNNKTLGLFLHSTPKNNAEKHDAVVVIDGQGYAVRLFNTVEYPEGTPIKDDNGLVYAIHMPKRNIIHVMVEDEMLSEEDQLTFLKSVITAVKTDIIDEIANQNMWDRPNNQERLIGHIKDTVVRDEQEQLARKRRDLGNYENNIRDLQRNMKQAYEGVIRLRREIEATESGESETLTKVKEQFNLIVSHPRFERLEILGDKLSVHIPQVYAYTAKGERFYIGNMRVEVNLFTSHVYFFGDNPRRGYWGQDPHPHVSGSSHQACLGNIAQTLAELSAQKEYYAMVLTCMDFLENANIEDPAGKKIYNWDEVDEEGSIIKQGGRNKEDYYTGESFNLDQVPYVELYRTWDNDDEIFTDMRYTTQENAEEHAIYNDDHDVWVTNDAQEQFTDWRDS